MIYLERTKAIAPGTAARLIWLRLQEKKRQVYDFLIGKKSMSTLSICLSKVTKLSKQAKIAAGQNMVKVLVENLWEPANIRLNVVLSIPRTKDHEVIQGNVTEAIFHRLLHQTDQYSSLKREKKPAGVLNGFGSPSMQQYVRHLGFDLSTGKELDKSREVYRSYDLYDRIWQGDGITNCLSTLRSNKDLKRALNLRDVGGHPHKVR